jgi:hypothetical protein
VGRLEQDYLRAAGEGGHQRYEYSAPAFGFACRLVYDESGPVLDYPGIAVRVICPPAVRPATTMPTTSRTNSVLSGACPCSRRW